MDLSEIHQLLDFALRKSENGFLSPEEKDRVINRAQIEVFEDYKKVYRINQQIKDVLGPFETVFTINNANSVGGLITFPANYAHLVVVETVVNDAQGNHPIPVEDIEADEAAFRRNSQLIPVSVYNPIGVKNSNSYQVYPNVPFAGKAIYLKKPKDCKFAYTLVNNRHVYDLGNSVQLEWNEAGTNKVINKALQLLGINLADTTTVQYSIAQEGKDNG